MANFKKKTIGRESPSACRRPMARGFTLAPRCPDCDAGSIPVLAAASSPGLRGALILCSLGFDVLLIENLIHVSLPRDRGREILVGPIGRRRCGRGARAEIRSGANELSLDNGFALLGWSVHHRLDLMPGHGPKRERQARGN